MSTATRMLQRVADLLIVLCSNFKRLSPNVQKRLAVENDDKGTQWSITDLLPLHHKIGQSCSAPIPLSDAAPYHDSSTAFCISL